MENEHWLQFKLKATSGKWEPQGIMEPRVVRELVCHRACPPLTEQLLVIPGTQPHMMPVWPNSPASRYHQNVFGGPCFQHMKLKQSIQCLHGPGIKPYYHKRRKKWWGKTERERREGGREASQVALSSSLWPSGLFCGHWNGSFLVEWHGRWEKASQRSTFYFNQPVPSLVLSSSPLYRHAYPPFLCLEPLSSSWLPLFVWKTHSGFFQTK